MFRALNPNDLLSLISSFIKLKRYLSKASLKPIISREWRTEERDMKDVSGCFYSILPCKIATDGAPIMSFILRSSVRRPLQVSSTRNLLNRLYPADFLLGHNRESFTQFCCAKLQRTGKRLCLSYYVLPSAARSFPPLRTHLPCARPKDLRPLESQFFHTF